MYQVTWTIELDADTPRAAAEKALEWLRDHESLAHVFEVFAEDGEQTTVDLDLDLESETEEI